MWVWWSTHTFSNLHTALHACSGSIVQTGAVVIVGGVDIGLLVLASLQPGSGPAQDHLAAGKPTNVHTQHYLYVNFDEGNGFIQYTFHTNVWACTLNDNVFTCLYLQAVCTTLLVPLGSGQSGRQRSLWQQQDLWALAQHVEARLVVHIALVGVPLFTEQEGPIRCRRERRD